MCGNGIYLLNKIIMDSKDKCELKRLFNQIGLYQDKIQGILDRYQDKHQTGTLQETLIIENLNASISYLWSSYCSMEEVISDI